MSANESIAFNPTTVRYVRLHRPEARVDVKLLNALFPYTSNTDKLHMTTNLASLVFRYLNPNRTHIDYDKIDISKRLKRVNEFFAHIAIGTNQVLVLTWFIAIFGHQAGYLIESEILHRGVGYATDELQKDLLKQISIGVRRTQKRVDGRPLTYQGVSVLAYHELAFGRSKNVSGWENEIKIRCTRTNHIQMKNIEEKIKIRDTVGKH